MTAPRFVSWIARIALIAIPVTVSFVGCSRQSEGERCDQLAAGDTDCNAGLVCVTCIELAGGSIDRCCPPNAADFSDPDCRRADPPRNNDPQCSRATGGTGGMGFGGFGARDGGMSGSATGGTSGSGDSGGEGGA
ncbi:MAG TPA: hypothetical protein VFZ53_07890 [Polyangiaceae bacterium]